MDLKEIDNKLSAIFEPAHDVPFSFSLFFSWNHIRVNSKFQYVLSDLRCMIDQQYTEVRYPIVLNL
jgi:hypothetical protein